MILNIKKRLGLGTRLPLVLGEDTLSKGGSGGAEAIGGVTIGQAGDAGTPYEGLVLTAGDDFDTLPSRWSTAAKSGRYSSSAPQSGSRRSQNNFATATGDAMIYVDPGFRGNRSQLSAALPYEPLTASASILTITAATAPNDLKDVSPAEYSLGGGDGSNKPTLYSGRLCTWPSFMLAVSGDWVFEAKVRFPAGVTDIPGWWPSAWTSALLWPDYQEYDLFEGRTAGADRTFEANINGSTVDSGGNVTQTIIAPRSVPAGRFVTMVVRKSGNTVTQYDDINTEGVLTQRATYTNARVSRFRGAHEIRLELAINAAWQAFSYNAADWPKAIDLDFWRVWTPPSAPQNTELVVLPDANTTPGGSWASTFPAAADIYGFTPDVEEIYAAFDNMDNPGAPTKSAFPTFLPGGMTVNKSTRAISGTVPQTEGGRTAILFIGSRTVGGAAARAVKFFNVAPAPQSSLFANQSPAQGANVSLTVAKADFHSGNLGPHTYVVTETAGGADFTISGNGTDNVTISGTANTLETTTLQIACTNAIGQTTTVTRTISTGAAANPNADYFNNGSGGFPDGWTDRWATGENWVENAGGFARAVTAATIRGALSFDQPGNVLNVETLIKVRTTGFADGAAQGGVILRGAGAAGSETGYRFLFNKNGAAPSLILTRFVGGVAITLAQANFSWTANNWFWLRARINGNILRARAWADGAAEPTTWAIDLTDTDITAAGWVGLGISANATTDWDQFSYAIDGATAQP